MLLKSMMFESKVNPTDRTKSAEELASQRKAALDEIEHARLNRSKQRSKLLETDGTNHNSQRITRRNDDEIDDFLDSADNHARDIIEESSGGKGTNEFVGEISESNIEENVEGDEVKNIMSKIVEYISFSADKEEPHGLILRKSDSLMVPSSELSIAYSRVTFDTLVAHFIRLGNDLWHDGDQKDKLLAQINHTAAIICNFSQELGEYASLFWGSCIKNFTVDLLDTTSSEGTCWPEYGKILVMKLIGHIFSTSDAENSIIVAASLYLTQCLSLCPLKNNDDIFSGLPIVSILMDYSSNAPRVFPEALRFLQSSIVLLGKYDTRCVSMMSVAREVLSRCQDFTAFPEIAQPILRSLKILAAMLDTTDSKSVGFIDEMERSIQETTRDRHPLRWREVGLSVQKSVQPRIEINFSLKSKVEKDSDMEYKHLQKKARREKKAVMRELRRDSAYLSQEKNKSDLAAAKVRRDERHANFARMEEEVGALNRFVKGEKIELKGGGSSSGNKGRRR